MLWLPFDEAQVVGELQVLVERADRLRNGTNQIIQALTPSFNFPRPTITDGTDSVRPATLRGLGPDQVLVLVNGKRRHPSALVHVNGSIGRGSTGVDLNAIPASAIQRIEVLRDGAAAQYGSDAIAGVINIVLKSGQSPLNLSFKGGMTTHSDGELVDASAGYGWSLSGGGSLFATVEYRDRGETNRAGPDPRDQIVTGDGGRNSVTQPNFHWGDADVRDVMTFLNAEIPLVEGGSRSLYAFGGLSRRTGSHGGFFRRAIQDTNWPSIYPEGFLPLIEPDIVDASGTVGVRGVSRGWFWDASGQYRLQQFRLQRDGQFECVAGAVNSAKPDGVLFRFAHSRSVPRQHRLFASGRRWPRRPVDGGVRVRVPGARTTKSSRENRTRISTRDHLTASAAGLLRVRRSFRDSALPMRSTRHATALPRMRISKRMSTTACDWAWRDASSATVTSGAPPTAR